MPPLRMERRHEKSRRLICVSASGYVNDRISLFHPLFKTEHAVKVFTFIIVLFTGFRIMWIRMVAVVMKVCLLQ